MHFFMEIVLVAIAVACAGGVLRASFRSSEGNPIPRYLLALLAWVPMWFFTHLLWHPLTGHHSALGYPWWFWLLWLIGVVLTAVSILPGVQLLAAVRFVGLVLVVASLFFVSWFGPVSGKSHVSSAAPSATSSPSATPSSPSPTPTVTLTTTLPAQPIDADSVAKQVNDVFQGYQKDQVGIGSTQIDWTNHQEAHGSSDFSPQTLKTQADVAKFLNGSSDQSQAAKARVIDALKAAGYGDAEIKRALDGSGYFPVQAKVASQFMGTTYFSDGKVLDIDGQWRQVGANDVFWIFLAQDSKIVKAASIRADCGNPNLVKVVPVTPSTPYAPPATCAKNCTPPCVYNANLPADSKDCHAAPPVVQPPVVKTCQELGNCYTPPPVVKTCQELGNCYTPPPPPPAKTCSSEYGPGYTGVYPNCNKAAQAPQTTYVPPPPSSAPGPNPAPVPVVVTPTSGAPTTQATSAQCYYETDGSPASGPGPGIRCS